MGMQRHLIFYVVLVRACMHGQEGAGSLSFDKRKFQNSSL